MAANLRPMTIYPISVRRLEVLAVADVTPGMRRVTLGGPGLSAHTAPNGMPVNAFRSDGFDDEFKLFLTHPNRTEPLFPEQGDGHVIWPRDAELVSRTYTVRRWDAQAGQLDVDFVVHGMGAATTWARRAQVGDVIPVAGPKSSAPHPQGADWTLVAGDETALPAIGRWLEEWPEGARGQVFVEIAEDEHRQDLVVPEGVELTWLSRHGAAPGTTTVMFDALRAAPWWDGEVFAWVAGEATTLVPIRRWLRGEKGLAKENVEVTGYWRRTEQAASSTDPELPAEGGDEGPAEALHELTEIVPGIAVRVAVTLGVVEALASGPLTAADVARRCGSPVEGMTLLLSYLAALEVLEAEGKTFALAAVGRELLDDWVADQLDLRQDGAARELTAALALVAALSSAGGQGARADERAAADTSQGGGLALLGRREYLDTPPVVASHLEAAQEFGEYYASTLVATLPVLDLARFCVVGSASAVVARCLLEASREVEVTVLAPPSHLDVIAQELGERERLRLVPGSVMSPPPEARADAVLLLGVVTDHGDVDARHVLGEASRLAPSTYVFEGVLDPADVDEHDAEEALLSFALGGGRERTEPELRGLFHDAGLRESGRDLIGWGGTLYRLER